MTYQRKNIPLTSLLLDPENARHGVQEDQDAAVRWMATQSKVQVLAKSIATVGISPSDLPVVMPYEEPGFFVVLEGNRRTAALKLLVNPDLCPDESARAVFRKLRSEATATLPVLIECVVFPDFQTAAPWLKLRHLGEQEGAGTVPWGAKENENFASRLDEQGPNSVAYKLLEYALADGSITSEQFAKVPLTTLTRLINTPEVRQELGLEVNRGDFSITVNIACFRTAFGDLLQALSTKEGSVTNLKTKDQRISFITKLKREKGWQTTPAAPPPSEEPPPAPQSRPPGQKAGAGEQGNARPQEGAQDQGAPEAQKATRTPRHPRSRAATVPSNFHLRPVNTKMLKIFRELKVLNANDFTMAASVLMRVFVEGCIDLYMGKNGVTIERNDTLAIKARKVREHMLAADSGNQRLRDDLKGLEAFSNSPQSIGSANTFNAVVHNTAFVLTASELKDNWDRIQASLSWFEGHI